MKKIACFSVAAMDRFLVDGSFHPGGNALNQALRFRGFGHLTAFVGGLGTDGAGDRIAALLTTHDVDTSRVRRLAGITACNIIRNDAAGERFGEEGAWQNGAYGEFTMTEADWGFLADWPVWSTHANCPDFQAALAHKRRDQFLAVDFLHFDDLVFLESCLPRIDVAYFGGTPEMADGLAQMAARHDALLVLTLGAGGSVAFEGSKVHRQAALPVARVVDTTGCGDAFQAGFSSARVGGADVPAALLAGAMAGQLACQHLGALGDLGL